MVNPAPSEPHQGLKSIQNCWTVKVVFRLFSNLAPYGQSVVVQYCAGFFSLCIIIQKTLQLIRDAFVSGVTKIWFYP